MEILQKRVYTDNYIVCINHGKIYKTNTHIVIQKKNQFKFRL